MSSWFATGEAGTIVDDTYTWLFGEDQDPDNPEMKTNQSPPDKSFLPFRSLPLFATPQEREQYIEKYGKDALGAFDEGPDAVIPIPSLGKLFREGKEAAEALTVDIFGILVVALFAYIAIEAYY